MSIPELGKRGYPQSMIIGTLAGSATLGLLIPPSIILIVYGVATEQSIARLFIGGVLPGLLLIVMFMGLRGDLVHAACRGDSGRGGKSSVWRKS